MDILTNNFIKKDFNMSKNKKLKWFFLFILCLPVSLCSALEKISSSEPDISFFPIIIGLIAGLVFFLMGMETMAAALKNFAGGNLRKAMTEFTKNRVRGFFSGIFISSLLQSNSAATVMIVGFVQAGLVSFSASLAVILGANVGATVTTQIIAFNIFEYSIFFIGTGFFLKFFCKNVVYKNIGNALTGFGLLFYGLDLMSGAVLPLKESTAAILYLKEFSCPLYSLLAGLVFTAIIQSSNASTGIAMIMAEGGLISVQSAISVMIGANIGTCITAVLACIGASRQAKRTALVHLFFKSCGAVIFFSIIVYFAEFSTFVTSFLSNSPARIIANAHTMYNLGIALIFLPFTVPVSLLLIKIFPEKKSDYEIEFTTNLDLERIPPADAAIEFARNEISRCIEILIKMFIAGSSIFVKNKIPDDTGFNGKKILKNIKIKKNEIDFLENKISSYLFMVVRNDIPKDKVARAYAYISIEKDIQSISALLEKAIPELYLLRKNAKSRFSDEGQKELSVFQKKTIKQLIRLKQVLDEPDFETAASIMQKEQKYLDLRIKHRTNHLNRLAASTKETIETHRLHMGLMNLMTQIITYSGNIAKTFLEIPEIGRYIG